MNSQTSILKLYDLLNGPSFPEGEAVAQDLHLKLHVLGIEVGWPVLPRLDLGWRYVSGSRTPGIDDEDLGGPTVGLSVRFPN